MLKYIVMSTEGQFVWEFKSVNAAFREGRKKYVRDAKRAGWRDAKVLSVYPDGSTDLVGKLFGSKAEYSGYALAWNDVAEGGGDPGDVAVNTSEVEPATL